MDTSNYFTEKCLFGPFPTQTEISKLEQEGVTHVINLTYDNERFLEYYHTVATCIKYPIKDGGTPDDASNFFCFIAHIADIIQNLGENNKIYLHCKGGHSRSVMVACCIMLYLFPDDDASKILEQIEDRHKTRKHMKSKWKEKGIRELLTPGQLNFVYNFRTNK